MQILVVDDQPSNRDVLATILGYYGHTVSQAADGVEALSMAARQIPDLIISDVLMPTMDGYEFVRRLRQEAALASKPVIFYTAHYLQDEALALARKCGVSYVLRKPCEPADVMEAVRGALGTEALDAAHPKEIAEEHLELITTRLSKTAGELSVANLRLHALIDAGRQLATEHDSARLIDQYARVARQIVGAAVAVIGVLDPGTGKWRHVGMSGFSEDAAEKLLEQCGPGHAWGSDCCPGQKLEVVIQTPQTVLGRLCIGNQPGGRRFTEDEEQLARTLAAQLAAAYQNALLFEEARHQAEELEMRVRQRTSELEAAHQELEAFTFAVSHDLRAHLHNLNGLAFLLEERFGQRLEPQANDLLQRIQRASCQMADLVKSLLELSRVSKQDIQFDSVSLDALLEETLAEVKASCAGRSIEWKIHALPAVTGSATLLKQVLVNLLSNAVKFTGRTQSPVIEVGVADQGGRRAIYVRDNGAGFDPLFADQMFGVFKRLHKQSEFPGHGAGLSIVQRIVRRHGGTIWAESSPGEGATFYFTLNEHM